MQRFYDGGCLETGGTAIHNKVVAPAIKWLFAKGYILPTQIVYDFGAGNGRNADWLREQGCTVYAYDPYNGIPVNNGFTGVSSFPYNIEKPLDIFLTCFVLNVVPYYMEQSIIELAEKFSPTHIHVTRGNREIAESVRKQLHKGRDTMTWDWYKTIYEGTHEYPHVNPDEVTALCTFGVRTTKGFQRNTHLNELGFTRIKDLCGYAIDTK